MEAKKTIAILGLKKGSQKTLLDQLANDHRILIVSNDIDTGAEASDYTAHAWSEETVELIDCPKNGCWEADIIFIWNPDQQPAELLERLQAVTTQKIVLLIINDTAQKTPAFPHSKTVILATDLSTNKTRLTSDYPEALTVIRQLLATTWLLKTEQTLTH